MKEIIKRLISLAPNLRQSTYPWSKYTSDCLDELDNIILEVLKTYQDKNSLNIDNKMPTPNDLYEFLKDLGNEVPIEDISQMFGYIKSKLMEEKQ